MRKEAKSTVSALQERVKELTCLLRMADIAGEPGVSIYRERSPSHR